jgi:hypothetical protein
MEMCGRRPTSSPCRPISSGSSSEYVDAHRPSRRRADPYSQSNSSFIVKRVVEGPVFNKEPVNITRHR